ncbi:MAG: hypothetical protein K6B41_08095 [Butyrivibrio sp.]|nr:hypothetical protein [Butyrivibrio sp.]
MVKYKHLSYEQRVLIENRIKAFPTLSNRDNNKIKYTGAILLDAHNKSELKIPIAATREFILANYNQFEILDNPITDELSDDIDYFN